jgi:hypothetical protein
MYAAYPPIYIVIPLVYFWFTFPGRLTGTSDVSPLNHRYMSFERPLIPNREHLAYKSSSFVRPFCDVEAMHIQNVLYVPRQ